MFKYLILNFLKLNKYSYNFISFQKFKKNKNVDFLKKSVKLFSKKFKP